MAEFDEGRDRNDLGAWLYPPRRRGCWTRLLAVGGALMDDAVMHERVSVNVSFERDARRHGDASRASDTSAR